MSNNIGPQHIFKEFLTLYIFCKFCNIIEVVKNMFQKNDYYLQFFIMKNLNLFHSRKYSEHWYFCHIFNCNIKW